LKVYTVSDIHVDYEENFNWLNSISDYDYQDDILILAGDISDNLLLIGKTFNILKKKFKKVIFVPGNHDLWVKRNKIKDSLTSFNIILGIAEKSGIETGPVTIGSLSVVPLFGWYDFSFGVPSKELISMWLDFQACIWPENYDEKKITKFFLSLNEKNLGIKNEYIISFSHFLPLIDIMPDFIPLPMRVIYPALGSKMLDEQIRTLKSDIHIYGHSHVNVRTQMNGVLYINNAFGYPAEKRIAAKKLLSVYEY